MESLVVNARIPAAKKESARPVLERLGASTTDLINSAYDYLLAQGELPKADKLESSKRASGFRDFLNASTLDVDWGDDLGKSYKQLLAEGKQADYESLA